MENLPSTIGPYRVVRKLGEGGMGMVFEAIHGSIERRIAIKVLRAEYAHNQDIAARFFNEARAVNIVEHPGLVQISDFGQLPDGSAYLVMEYLKGESLAKRIHSAASGLPVGEVLQIAWQIADSLAAAHDKGIIHRDLKPENVMLVPDPHMPIGERVKILDFGLAKVAQISATGPEVKTRSNVVMGTPLYMSPEQCEGAGKVDGRSDVYSLGCMMFEMLSGTPPFNAEGTGQLLGMHMFKEPPLLGRLAPAVPKPLSGLVHKLLHKSREQRPPMRELAKQIEGMFSLAPPPTRRILEVASAASGPTAAGAGPSQTSTLGHVASQQATRPTQKRRGWITGGALSLVGLLGALAIIWPRPAASPTPVATAPPVLLARQGTPDLGTSPAAGLLPQAVVSAPPAPPAGVAKPGGPHKTATPLKGASNRSRLPKTTKASNAPAKLLEID